MSAISITRLRLRRLRYIPAFVVHTLRTHQQLRRSPGFLGGYLAIGPRLTLWTVTAWTGLEAMREFRRTGTHLKAMPHLLYWCDEASVATLTDVAETLPEPAEAARRLRQDGRISKVRNPSAAQTKGELWPDGRVPRQGTLIRPV